MISSKPGLQLILLGVFLASRAQAAHTKAGRIPVYPYIFSHLGFFLISVLPRKATFVLGTLREVGE
jgi:hypothetical protein